MTEESRLDEFLSTAELAGTEFTAGMSACGEREREREENTIVDIEQKCHDFQRSSTSRLLTQVAILVFLHSGRLRRWSLLKKKTNNF